MINNRSNTNLVLASLALAAVCLSCSLLKGVSGNSPYGIGDTSRSPLPAVDGNEPFPAMSTDAINALVTEMPEIAEHRDKILEAERAAINGLLADVRPKPQANNVNTEHSNVAYVSYESRSERHDNFIGRFNLIPAAYAADDPPAIPPMGGLEFYLIGHQIAFINDDLGKVNDQDRGKSRKVEMKDDAGNVEATMTKAIDKDSGAVSVELTTSVNMPVFGLNANSKVKLTGGQCPDPEGKVDLTIEYSTNGRAGSSGSMIYDKTLTGKIKAIVNDSAEIASMDVDLKQATRSTAGGRQVYVETSQSGRATSGSSSDLQFNDVRIDRASSQATAADADLSRDGLAAAFNVARAVLDNAQSRWQGGGCVQIIADSPGTVAVNSTTQIPVKVTHKADGSEVPSKLEAALSGGSSIDPTLIPRTAGTLTYTAPGETGRSATIKLTANSHRGRAKLDLTANTGANSYRVNGKSQGATFTGDICSLGQPFVLNVNSITGSWPMKFTPTDERSGQMEGTFSANGCTQSGGGPYTISLNSDGSGTIKFTYNSTATCPAGSTTTSRTSELPLKPAPDLKCN